MVFGIGLFLVSAYSPFISALLLNLFFPGLFSVPLLAGFAIVVTSITILAVCWVVFLAVCLRWVKMRQDGPFPR